ARDAMATLRPVAPRSRRWDEAQKKLGAARGKLASSESVLASAVAIEKEYARLKELRDVLPAVSVIVTERGRIGESERKTELLTKHRGEKADERRTTENGLGQARTKLANLTHTPAHDHANH